MSVRHIFFTRAFLIVAIDIVHISTANAGIIFFDDFSDGDATDGSPASWAQGDLGVEHIEVVNGNLILLIPTYQRKKIVIPQIPLLGNVSFRWQGRIFNFPASQGYWMQIAYGNNETRTRYGGRLIYDFDGTTGFFSKRINGGPHESVITGKLDHIAPHLQDVVLQLDVFDSEIAFWAWNASDPMPSEPFVHITDSDITEGKLGIEFGTSDGNNPPSVMQMAVRYFAASDTHIPEPSSLLLASLAGVLICCRRRRA